MSDQLPTVLYVDDDQDYLDAMRTILESAGYRMIEAHSAEEALKLIPERWPDLILADLMMEEVDAGITFVKEVRALGDAAPILMVSSVGNTLAMQIDAAELGLLGVLQKPVDRATLLPLVEMALAAGASRRRSDDATS